MLLTPDWRGAANHQTAALALQNCRGMPIRFVPQEALPPGMAYEAFIAATGQVPSRGNLHDFFNALIWLHFPLTKIALNALQAAELDRASVAGTGSRGKMRDAATIFDENAAIFVVLDPALITALRAHDWNELFMKQRPGFGQAWEVRLFGHAALEKLVSPYKAITAHAWTLLADAGYFQLADDDKLKWIDLKVSEAIAGGLSMEMFAPLPVAGLPGWWDEQGPAFYADTQVFRPSRIQNRSIKFSH